MTNITITKASLGNLAWLTGTGRMAEWVSGLADLPKINAGHLIPGFTIFIHHTGFIVNQQLEI